MGDYGIDTLRLVVKDRKCMAYGSVGMFLGMVHNLFLIYHVELFVSHYKIGQGAFWWGELIFLLWNCTNDFITGWISDSKLLQGGSIDEAKFSARVGTSTIAGRVRGLFWGGPMMGVAFMLILVPWTGVPVGVQFAVSLCVYDGFLTWVDLSYNALLSDLAHDDNERAKMNTASAIFSTFGSISVFISHSFWDTSDLTAFRQLAALIVVVSSAGFIYAASTIQQEFRPFKAKSHGGMELPDGITDISNTRIAPPATLTLRSTAAGRGTSKNTDVKWYSFLAQLSKSSNFMWFSLLSLVQTFHCHFNSNFFPLFLSTLLGEHLSPMMLSTLLGVSFVAPHINNIFFSMLVTRIGLYRVVQGLLFTKLALAGAMLLLGPNSWVVVCFFVASNRVFTEGTCKLCNLVMSDLVDEDYLRNARTQSVSALLFGTNALLSKPGQTIAPVFGTWYIAKMSGSAIFSSDVIFGDMRSTQERMAEVDNQALLKHTVFQLLVWVPIFCGVVQLFAWSRYTLKGDGLQTMRKRLADGEEGWRQNLVV